MYTKTEIQEKIKLIKENETTINNGLGAFSKVGREKALKALGIFKETLEWVLENYDEKKIKNCLIELENYDLSFKNTCKKVALTKIVDHRINEVNFLWTYTDNEF